MTQPADITSQPPASSAGSAEASEELRALRAIVEGTASGTGVAFFESLVKHLAGAMGVRYAFVAEFSPERRVRTIAFWVVDKYVETTEWDLAGTPCEEVVRGALCHYPSGVAARFPLDKPLTTMGIESFIGVPLMDDKGYHLGHLAVFDEKPMASEPRKLFIFRIFAARAAAELARLKIEQSLGESEKQFRDLYQEAPIAYVHEGTDSRFISCNNAALRLLGVKPEEIEGTYGLDLCAPTPENKAAIENAFHATSLGKDQSLPILELRRKDNGKAVFVRWWSKPDRDGKTTRTMFIDITEQVLMEREQKRLQQQNLYLQEEIKSVHNFEEIVGQSTKLLEAIEKVNRVAKTDASVLITGETGTGKELFARAIHSASRRKEKPLIKLNCAALPTSLVESELFGHEKGAFSGALARRIGRFELAQGGTIFLDEIGEVPMDVQVKLLRVLQEREFERVGGTAPIKVDVRIVAATNRDLRKAIAAGTFREDLFYRLNVFPLVLPPLREREGDVSLLARFLIEKYAARVGRRIDGIDPATVERLQAYHWPGNIRELENVLERAIILSNSPTLEINAEVFGSAPAELPASAVGTGSEPAAASDLESIERKHILAALKDANWVIDGARGAAKTLGLNANTLRSRMKKMGIERPG